MIGQSRRIKTLFRLITVVGMLSPSVSQAAGEICARQVFDLPDTRSEFTPAYDRLHIDGYTVDLFNGLIAYRDSSRSADKGHDFKRLYRTRDGGIAAVGNDQRRFKADFTIDNSGMHFQYDYGEGKLFAEACGYISQFFDDCTPASSKFSEEIGAVFTFGYRPSGEPLTEQMGLGPSIRLTSDGGADLVYVADIRNSGYALFREANPTSFDVYRYDGKKMERLTLSGKKASRIVDFDDGRGYCWFKDEDIGCAYGKHIRSVTSPRMNWVGATFRPSTNSIVAYTRTQLFFEMDNRLIPSVPLPRGLELSAPHPAAWPENGISYALGSVGGKFTDIAIEKCD